VPGRIKFSTDHGNLALSDVRSAVPPSTGARRPEPNLVTADRDAFDVQPIEGEAKVGKAEATAVLDPDQGRIVVLFDGLIDGAPQLAEVSLQ
jgi:hypothetical protein